MNDAIGTLLSRNLFEIFGERDPVKRRSVMVEILAEDCLFTDPSGVKRGYDAIDEVIAAIQAGAPDFVFSEVGTAQVLPGSGRLAWGFGPAGGEPQLTGQDFILVRDGRITAIYTFLDS